MAAPLLDQSQVHVLQGAAKLTHELDIGPGLDQRPDESRVLSLGVFQLHHQFILHLADRAHKGESLQQSQVGRMGDPQVEDHRAAE